VRFGVMQLSALPEGRSCADVVSQVVEQTVAAEELGFSCVWLAEHHFSDFGMVGSPLVLASALAAVTSRIRIGTAVLVLPFYEPVRLAEELALVDVLSGGRLSVGFGRGYQPVEFAGFSVAQDEARERTAECAGLVRRLLSEERVSHHGRFWSVEDVGITPRPVQRPGIPFFQAASSLDTFRLAGQSGSPILTSPNFTPLPTVRKQFDIYIEALREAGHDPRDFDRPLMQQVYVGNSAQDAFDTPRPHIEWMEQRKRALVPGAGGAEIPKGYESWQRIARNIETDTYQRRFEQGSLFGVADQLIDRIGKIRDAAPVTELICQFNFGGMPHDLVIRSMERFAKDVIPEFTT
jgi:natural product biosynthesis luciferase-like monooxygenase protein